MKTLKLIEFIKTHKNWRELLAGEPYYIKITTEGNYTIFKYNQLCSDFNNEIVRECRGLILDSEYKPVCVPFFKFGNYGESYCPEIDWATAKVQEKVDGSIQKLWYHNGQWRVSTNGVIDAYKAELQNDARLCVDGVFKTFGELFDVAAKNSGLNYDMLDTNNTYMFELVSPYNRVIVPYDKVAIYHLGTRNNATLEEVDVDIGIQKPKVFPINTLNDCIAAASELPFDEEGYVVVDANYNRIKIKSPKYVMAAHVRNNGCVTTNRMLDIIRRNEVEEFLLYCNDYTEAMNTIKCKINTVINRMEQRRNELSKITFDNQAEFAKYIKDDEDKNYFFQWRKRPELTPIEYFWNLRNEQIERKIENV